MPYDIVIGRNESDRKKFGTRGTVFLGKSYVKMGQTVSLSNRLLLDMTKAHVILVAGKRGSGKSYTLGVIAEEMTKLPPEISDNLSVIIFDTMGIFWSMKYANEREQDLLHKWGLRAESLDVEIFTPSGFFNEYKKKGIPTDNSFSIKPSELQSGDWCNSFGIDMNGPVGILISRIIGDLKDSKEDYSIKNIVDLIKKDKKSTQTERNAAENMFLGASKWGLFGKEGLRIKDLVKRGKVSVIDISCYTNVSGNWSIKGLVTGLVCKKLLQERMIARKEEEIKNIKKAQSIFTKEEIKQEFPLVWIMIDEAHEFIPKDKVTPATDSLVQLLREGRQPGISMILATQQPGQIHRDVITQSDIVISHRITAKIDIEALNSIMQTYLTTDILGFLNNLPSAPGSAIILDDNSERMYGFRVHPRRTWHGGEAPSALKPKRKLLDLGL